jgi:nicotinamidase-related amidase
MPNRALLVIDVQHEYFSGKLPVSHPPGTLANILRAMDAAHAAGVPIVVVQHTAPQPDSSVFRRCAARQLVTGSRSGGSLLRSTNIEWCW